MALVICLAGCDPFGVDTTPANIVDGNRDPSETVKSSGEPNDSFQQAIEAVVDGSGVALLQGTVSEKGDLDVFSLGALERGNQVVVQADTGSVGSRLDVSIALFDGDGRLVASNDDRIPSDLDSSMDLIVRHDSDEYFLVATHSAFSAEDRFTGAYELDVTITSGVEVPAPARQLILLDFDGGMVDSPVLGQTSILPFSAGAISRLYEGRDEELKTAIRESLERNFARFDVGVITSDDPPPAAGVEFTTIFMGGFNRNAFGIAEDVDLYNSDFCDDAIIYAESFDPSIFSTDPSLELLAEGIGNVTAHEAGHLLGLNHVSDDAALMDDRSAPDAFLLDQEFMEAPLSRDIMEIGTQDARLLLSETVALR